MVGGVTAPRWCLPVSFVRAYRVYHWIASGGTVSGPACQDFLISHRADGEAFTAGWTVGLDLNTVYDVFHFCSPPLSRQARSLDIFIIGYGAGFVNPPQSQTRLRKL